ncbi:MAG: hypothetical protein M3496_09530 [Pseudomonadota bacterium]|nr:hypothetical protein [Pseudomonadota bacterium]
MTSTTPRAGAATFFGAHVLRSNWSAVKKAAVGVARAQALELHHAAHSEFERLANAVEQVVQCGVVEGFLCAGAGDVHSMNGGKE